VRSTERERGTERFEVERREKEYRVPEIPFPLLKKCFRWAAPTRTSYTRAQLIQLVSRES